jgi:transposase
MTRPYSEDLRLRAVALVKDGQSCRAVARLLGLGESTVIRWVRRERQTGSTSAKPIGGRRRFVLLADRDWLIARMASGAKRNSFNPERRNAKASALGILNSHYGTTTSGRYRGPLRSTQRAW